MKRHWEVDELIEYWTLLPDEETLLGNKTGANRLGFAILLKFFQLEVRFPQHIRDIPKSVVVHLSKQVGVPSKEYHAYDWQGRSIKYHRAEIRSFLGFRKATVSDAQEMANWLLEQVLGHEQDVQHLEAVVIQRFRSQRIEPPTNLRINRLIRSALRTYEKNFFSSTLQKFSKETKTQIDAFLDTADSSEYKETTTLQRDDNSVAFSDLKADPGRVGLESLLSEVAKLQSIRQLALSPKLFESISPKVLEIYKLRVAAELPSQLRAHPEAIRYTLFAAVAFAFSHLLGFELLPRLKRIHSQKLYRSDAGNSDAYPNLQLILTRPIKWDLIRQQYDQMVKYTTALRLGTAEPEAILKRFTRANIQHPTYQALAELGKVIKTIFLCQYLQSEALRREINEGLNVVENWNSANSFIFYGKGGEVATNRLEEQELSVLCLHLLQICLVYINTLMIQQVLSEPTWMSRMKTEDFRALTPLIYSHVNPYGTWRLDLDERLLIDFPVEVIA